MDRIGDVFGEADNVVMVVAGDGIGDKVKLGISHWIGAAMIDERFHAKVDVAGVVVEGVVVVYSGYSEATDKVDDRAFVVEDDAISVVEDDATSVDEDDARVAAKNVVAMVVESVDDSSKDTVDVVEGVLKDDDGNDEYVATAEGVAEGVAMGVAEVAMSVVFLFERFRLYGMYGMDVSTNCALCDLVIGGIEVSISLSRDMMF